MSTAFLSGCQLLATGSPWGAAASETSAATDQYDCADCHEDIATLHRDGPHGAANIACGQCHRGNGHPEFSEPLDDRTCGGCHLPEYQQVDSSAHARRGTRAKRQGEGGPSGFLVTIDGARYFAVAADASGRNLCAACHFDEHRLSASATREPGFCAGCHADLGNHPRGATTRAADCIDCHMQRGTTVSGQTVTSHTFAPPRHGPP